MARPTKDDEVKNALQLSMKQITRTTSALNENQVQKIFNSTPRKYKYSRPAKGGGTWTYVRKSYVRRVLDSVFGFNWDFDIETPVDVAFDVASKTGTVVIKGTITARVLNENGVNAVTIRKTDFGRKEVVFKKDTKNPLDFGNDLKAAASDCLKRCAAQFGIAADVYESDEFMEIDVIGSEEQSDRRKTQESLVEKAKSQLETESRKVGGENGQS